AASIGRRAVLLDSRAGTLAVEPGWLGETRDFRVYAGSSDLTGTALSIALDAAPALPLPPVHLRAARAANGDIAMRWMRRSRADCDGLGIYEPSLQHVPDRQHTTHPDR